MSWYSAKALSDLDLPGLPASKRGIAELAKKEGWVERHDAAGSPLARERRGNGGGFEYHESLLPSAARARLIAMREDRDIIQPEPANRGGNAEAWTRFDQLKQPAKDKAMERVSILAEIMELEQGGDTRSHAISRVAKRHDIAASTIYGWFRLVEGVPRVDWVAFLAPGHVGCTVQATCSTEAWDMLLSLYLRSNSPTFRSCYDRVAEAAADHGWTVPSIKTLQRRLSREVPEATQILARKGPKAFARTKPAQRRDRSVFKALEAVNADGHLFDVRVQWPGEQDPVRVIMVAFQDIYSGKILSWRLSRTENSDTVRLAFGDLVSKWGVPSHVWVDNGRSFASKRMTGGTKRRFRWTLNEEEQRGIFGLLGVEVHFATPFHGQAKPIERAFRDLCDTIAKHPAFVGAYTGNSVANKPHDYGSKAIALDEFAKVVEQEIHRHNARTGRRSRTCAGRSFDETFAASYQASEVKKVTAEHRRLYLLASEQVGARKADGSIHFHGNIYWTERLVQYRGKKVVIRFDPLELKQPLAVYTLAGEFIAEAECTVDAGFNDTVAARDHARTNRKRNKAHREYLEASRRMGIKDAVARLKRVELPDDIEPGVIRADFGPGPAKPKRPELSDRPTASFLDGVADNVTELAAADPRRRRRG